MSCRGFKRFPQQRGNAKWHDINSEGWLRGLNGTAAERGQGRMKWGPEIKQMRISAIKRLANEKHLSFEEAEKEFNKSFEPQEWDDVDED